MPVFFVSEKAWFSMQYQSVSSVSVRPVTRNTVAGRLSSRRMGKAMSRTLWNPSSNVMDSSGGLCIFREALSSRA